MKKSDNNIDVLYETREFLKLFDKKSDDNSFINEYKNSLKRRKFVEYTKDENLEKIIKKCLKK